MVKKGDITEVKIDDLAYGGDAVGHLDDGLTVFVPGCIPDERVRIRIVSSKKSYARGELLKVLNPSPARKDSDCRVHSECGGCQFQHIKYQKQLDFKKGTVVASLERIGGLTGIEVNDVIPAEYPWQYRNKAQFPLARDEDGKIVTGFYRQRSHEIISNDNCLIQHPLINRVKDTALRILNEYEFSVYNERTDRGLLRHLLIRVGTCTNQALLTIVTSQKSMPGKEKIAARIIQEVPELVGVQQNINPEKTNVIMGTKTILLAGQNSYIDYIGPIKYRISPVSFFQINTLQAGKLYQKIADYAELTGIERVVDCYCGIGSISLFLAREAAEIIGIEEVNSAVKDARENANLNGINNCRFLQGGVEKILPDLKTEGYTPDIIIFDPPRKGLDKKVIETALSVRPEKIIYVSCNPTTLARDLKELTAEYEVKKVTPVDMFPQTYHIETVCRLAKKSK